jgi:hypothetical protein
MKSSATDHVEEIILALPLGDGHDKARAMATARLMIQAGMAFGRINDLPRARDAGTRQTERELRDLIKRAVNLARHISDMHSPALRAIEAQSPKMEPLSLVDLLGSLVGAAESAIDRLPTDAAPVRKGRYENRTATLYTAINRQGVLFFWPVKLPGPDGKILAWHTSGATAAEQAMTRWVRVTANMSLGAYDTFVATATIPDPEWPKHTFQELLRIAFKDRIVTSLDHGLVKRLRGLT